MMDERRREKLSLHLSQCSVLLFGCFCFSAMRVASLRYTIVAAGPTPPDVEKMSGVKEACSTSLILSSYALLFCCSFTR